MALNVYHEARGEDYIGRVAVASVTLNRVGHEYFPDTICDVVWQDSQFSWTIDSRSDTPSDRQSWLESLDVALLVLDNEVEDPTDGALFYHANYIRPPSWTRHMEVALSHGVHTFYHWDGSWQ